MLGRQLGGGPNSRFRRDIEGMRAIAVLAVVLYHAHVGLLRGGFTGVDDFYVISGFLITGLLWRQLSEDGRPSLLSFYGRRIRRLLPMSFLVLLATAIASVLFLPPLQAHAALKDGMSAAAYVSNYRFASLQTNYLTSSLPPSPFQQYWSLSLEEQFYLVWPVLLILGSLGWGRFRPARQIRQPSRTKAVITLAALGATSFIAGVWLTHTSQPWAFFSLPTRAWELAVGGLVAFAAHRLRNLPAPLASILGWAGLVMVVGSALVLSGSVPYPGFAALAPVLGTAAVIASGCAAPKAGPSLLLGRNTAQMVGRVSYSWYLWHWPILILIPVAIGHSLSLGENLTLVVASFAVAAISFVAIENPLRNSAWLRAQPRRALTLGCGLTLSALAVCFLSVQTLPSLAGKGRAAAAPLVSPSLGNGRTSYESALRSATSQVQQAVRHSLLLNSVPTNLVPSLPKAGDDLPPIFFNCQDLFSSIAVPPCLFGDKSSHSSIVLFGDSHASMWFSAVDSAAKQLGMGLHSWTKDACPPLKIPVFLPALNRQFTECVRWRQKVLTLVAKTHPALVVLGVTRLYTQEYGFTAYSPQWLRGLAAMVSAIRRLGPKVLVIGPIPLPPESIPDCLSVHLTSASACNIPLSQGINEHGKLAEERVVHAVGGNYFDPESLLCTASTCPAIVDNILVYRDDSHMTNTYASYLAPVITDELGLVLGGGRPGR